MASQNKTITPDYDPINFKIENFKSPAELRHLEVTLLKNIRGTKSQQQFSKKLGSKFNLYGKWENGTKKLMWDDFVKVLKLKKISLVEILEDIYKISDKAKKSEASIVLQHFLKFYFFNDYEKLANYLETSSLRVRRMEKNQSAIPASVILKLLVYRPQHFIIFLDRLNVSDSVPEIAQELQRMKTIAQGQIFSPANTAVLYFLDTKDYHDSPNHDVKLICKKLNLTTTQVESALSTLLANKSVEFDGHKYFLHSRSMEFPASDFRQTIPMFNYWIYRSLGYLNQKLLNNNAPTDIPNASSFRVFSVSRKTAEKITEKIRQTHHEILQMCKESDREDVVVRAIILNHFGLEESPPFKMASDPEIGFNIELEKP